MPNYVASKIIDPDINIFLCTEEASGQYQKLVKHFKDPRKEIIDAWDYEKIQLQIKKVVDKYSESIVLLNFTAGNKIMSIAGFNLFKDLKKECFYINTEGDEYIVFNFLSNRIHKDKINIKCNLENILSLNGQEFEFSNFIINEDHKKLIQLIQKDEKLLSKILEVGGKININAKDFEKKIDNGNYAGTHIKFKNFNSEVILYIKERCIFSKREQGKFLTELLFGKWFEYVCFEKLNQLRFFDNLVWGCNIRRKDALPNDIYGDKNEIDIIGNKGIYYYIFECKAGNIKAEAVDKLVSIKESYIGRYSSLFFISYFPLNQNNSAHRNVIEKMKDNNIIHLIYKDLDNKEKMFRLFNKRANLK